MLRVRSLRFRIAATFVVGTLVVSGLVAGTTYFLVSRQLTAERVNTVKRQSITNLRTATEFIRNSREPVTAADVRDQLQQRGNLVVIGQGVPASTSVRFDEDDIPPALRRAVRRGDVAYTNISDDNRRRMVFGSLIPDTQERGEAYFSYSLAALDRTLGILRRIFVAVIAGAALAAGTVGMRLATATIRPLRLAAAAARRVAEGSLETRLDVSGEDELGQLAASFNQMTAALEQRIVRERRFVADVSHELRTPLTALKTSIDFLAGRPDLPAKLRGPAGLAADEVRSLQRLVDDLLELSRVEAGGVVAEREEVDLVNFANEVARRRAPDADITISGPEALIVWTDKMRLERVVGNLLENAVFHGGSDGVAIAIERVDGEAKIVVADHGPGITAEQLPNIFERFWRGDSSRQRDGRIGAGLGLSIARENAMVIGADIDVESEPGHGTRFEVRIPAGA